MSNASMSNITRRLLVSVAALLVAAVAAAPAAAQGGSVIAKLTSFEGSVDVVRAGIPLALYPQLPLFSGDILHTRDGRATLVFEDRSEIRLKPQTRITVSETAERRDISVAIGRLWAFIVSQKERGTDFRTGGTISSIRGTKI